MSEEIYYGYNVLQSTITIANSDKYYFISTAHRESSCIHATKFYEALIWKNKRGTEEGDILSTRCHRSLKEAIADHVRVASVLSTRESRRKLKMLGVSDR